MAVAFDAVGSSTGFSTTTPSTTPFLTWTHTAGTGGGTVIVGFTWGSTGAAPTISQATYGGNAMTLLGSIQTNNAAGNGTVFLYGITGQASGANTVLIKTTANPTDEAIGNSISFTGATAFGAAVTNSGNSASATVTVGGTTSGNMAVSVEAHGTNAAVTYTSGTKQFDDEVSAASGASNLSGATIAAGGSVTLTDTITSDAWGAVGVEVRASPPPPVPVPAAIPGRTWLQRFRRPGFIGQQPPGPVMVTASPATATATATALSPAVVTVSAPAAPTFNPGRTWRKHFQWPQQQQLSGPPPLAWATAGLATATATANPTSPPFIARIAHPGTPAGYFADQFGNPRILRLEQAWALPWNAGRWNSGNWQADMDGYMSARGTQGMTAWFGTAWSDNHVDSTALSGGRTWDGIYPIVVNGTPGKITTGSETITLNDPFWQRIDYLFTSALKNGISCYLNLGMQYDFTGSPNIWFNLSTAQAYTFGALIVARYPRASYPNVFFFFGDDGSGGQDTFFTQMLSGITDAGDTRHVSVEQLPETNSHIEFDTTAVYLPGGFGEASANYNWVYTYDPSYNGVEKSYTELPVPGRQPVVWGDGVWYGDNSSTQNIADYTIRRFTWWALASGARGFNDTSGSTNNGLVWQWQNGALAAVTTDPNGTFVTSTCGVITTYFTSLAGWHTLIPDTGNVFITSGRGTKTTNDAPGFNPAKYGDSDNYVAGSITPDGSLAVIYCGQFFTITINQALLAPGYTATWVDPVTAATTATATGGTYNSTPLGNNSAGNADWVLVLQGPPAPPAPFTAQPALPGKTWRRYFQHPQQPVPPAPVVTGISVSAGLATATGTALGQDTGADIAMVSPNAGLPAATGTALGQDTGADIASVAPGAGLPAATGTALGQDTGADIAMVSPNAGLPAATGAALGASAQVVLPQNAAYPGAVWRKYFQHPQQPAAFTAPAPATNVSGGLAQATGTALGQDTGADIASVAPNAGLPAATAAALGATSSLATNGGTAAATGTGQNPAPSIAIGAAPAAGTGTALDASVVTTGAPPLMQVLPGRTWLRQFRHLQEPLPPPPFTAPPFQVARSTPSAAAPDTSAAGVSDPRDGTTSVAALATSSPGVT